MYTQPLFVWPMSNLFTGIVRCGYHDNELNRFTFARFSFKRNAVLHPACLFSGRF